MIKSLSLEALAPTCLVANASPYAEQWIAITGSDDTAVTKVGVDGSAPVVEATCHQYCPVADKAVAELVFDIPMCEDCTNEISGLVAGAPWDTTTNIYGVPYFRSTVPPGVIVFTPVVLWAMVPASASNDADIVPELSKLMV
mgnify:CR=1 FL=1